MALLDQCESMLSYYGLVAKMVCDDYLNRGRALRIAVGVMMFSLLLAGVSSAIGVISVNKTFDERGGDFSSTDSYMAVHDDALLKAASDSVHNINKGTSYTTIQAAINDANAGDEIHVESGTYFENVTVDKQLILKGDNVGGGKPIIYIDCPVNLTPIENGQVVIIDRPCFDGIRLESNGITIDGFVITRDSIGPMSGIHILSNNNIIINNNITNYFYGITISDNASSNMITGNIATSNYFESLLIVHSNSSIVEDNIFESNGLGYPFYNGSGIILFNSNNNEIRENFIRFNNDTGIFIENSNNNTLDTNLIYNNYFGNYNNFGIINSTSNWNTTAQAVINIIGGSYLGGNFWGNPVGTGFSQNCTDVNSDGICDSTYTLDSYNIDYLPLVYNNTTVIIGAVHNINKGTKYTTIQAAIDDASPGDEIRVESGTYYENVNVNKRLILRGIGMPVVDARGSGSAITLAVDGIVIEGLTVTGCGSYPEAGVKVNSNNNTLIGNHATSNSYNGIYLSDSNNNTLIGNHATLNSYNGIYLSDSSNNTLSGNNASNNNWGIFLVSSSNNNNLSGNNANSNTYLGISLDSSDDNILIENNALKNGDGINLYSSSNNNTLIKNKALSNNWGISLWASKNNTLISNIADSNVNDGISMGSSSNNTLMTNNASNNRIGIHLQDSMNNIMFSNTIVSNNYEGLLLYNSIINVIYNNYINNTNNAWDNGNNIWNITKTPRKNIIGGPYMGGNFWANPSASGFSQTCADVENDGICDSNYTLNTNNIDYLPLSMNFTLDNTPPSSITNLKNLSYVQNYINFTWINPSDPDYHHVMLYLNGSFRTNITAPQNYHNFTGLQPDTLYELGTHTVDTSGNVNETWVNATARTLPLGGVPPVADCGHDKLKCENVGSPVQFNGSASYDPDGSIISYYWDFGDGTNGTGAVLTHKYSTYRWNGTTYQPFTVNLTVTDNDGMTNSSSMKVVIWIPGDANGDGKVNILDASIIGLKWGTADPCSDLNNDGKVNIMDASIIGIGWGKIPIIQ